jgi:hypothetical protein
VVPGLPLGLSVKEWLINKCHQYDILVYAQHVVQSNALCVCCLAINKHMMHIMLSEISESPEFNSQDM